MTGLWTGALSNDSTTVRKDQSFEIALTEYRGKVYGYSRSEFIVDDVLYYIVKRVSGTILGDVCEVTDDEIVSYNFPKLLDKKIKVTSTFRRNQNDSIWHLDGTWKTNVTKKYYAVTGKVTLEEEKDLTASKIFPHLEELNLADGIAFYKDRKEELPIVKMVKPEKIKTEYSTRAELLSTNNEVAITTAKPVLERAEAKTIPTAALTTISDDSNKPIVTTTAVAEEDIAAVKKPIEELPKINSKKVGTGEVDIAPSTVNKSIAENKISDNNTEEEIVAVKKTDGALPKTDTKNIGISSVGVTPSAPINTIAENNQVPVAIITPEKTAADVAANKESPKQEVSPATPKNNSTVSSNTTATNNKPLINETGVKTTTKQEQVIANISTNKPQQIQNDSKTVVKTNIPAASTSIKPIAENKKQDVASMNPVKTSSVVTNNPLPEKKEIKTETAAVVAVVPETKKAEADILLKSAIIAGRKSEFSQVVSFKSDSLQISLYDNGEVDGDTVTIFMNGEAIISKQVLKASALKKTIYLSPGTEQFSLVMFAENLGKYAPNTGLLVVRDGDDVYNLRFSSDFQKNAGIVFRRKR